MTERTNRIVVIGAHPADPFERAGGTMVNHLRAGDDVFVVSLTTGVVTHAFGIFPATGEDKLADIERVKSEKRQEFERAAERLGATGSTIFDFAESPLAMRPEECAALVHLIREIRPNVVLCAHPVEVGRFDHMDSGTLALRSIDYARADGYPDPMKPHGVAHVLFFHYDNYQSEQWMGSARRSADVIVDTSEAHETKLELMSMFGST